MDVLISLLSVLSILVYALAVAFSFLMYGKTGKKFFQYAGAAMFVAVCGVVGWVGQRLLELNISGHTLVAALVLAFNIIEIYLFAKAIHTIFEKPISAAIYIWLCVIIMINGFVSPFPVDLALWIFLAFNISIVILGVFYWESLMRETEQERQREAAKYSGIILTMVIFAVAVLAYSVVNLSLFQKIPSRSLIDAFYIVFGLITAVWLSSFCQQEYEACESCSLKEAFFRTEKNEAGDTEYILETEGATQAGSFNQMEACFAEYDLTERETEILRLILLGKSNQEISEELFITVGTVKAHVHSIFGKMNVSRRSQLISRFMELDM